MKPRRFAQLHPDGVCRHDGTRHREDGTVDCPLMRPAPPKHATCGNCGGDDWRIVTFCADCGEPSEKVEPNIKPGTPQRGPREIPSSPDGAVRALAGDVPSECGADPFEHWGEIQWCSEAKRLEALLRTSVKNRDDLLAVIKQAIAKAEQ